MITDDQWEAMKREARAEKYDDEKPVRVPWYRRFKIGGDIGMLSRWTGEQGKKDLQIPVWKKIYARIFIKGEF